ncbi:hypothetical protein FACS1894145_7280 [Bacteroidia bacterium]|nr:hypothetical protein FACS1894145_7280 [Bacteroidia bacterium]
MLSEAKSKINPVSANRIQAFYTDRFQLYDVIEVLLNQLDTVCDSMYITSFSIPEEFIRKIFRFKQLYTIGHVILLLDSKAAVKISKLLPFARNVFDEVYLTNNHGKVVLFGADPQISICTSQNQTRGNRKEATVITTDPDCYQSFYEEIQAMIKTGIKL